MIETGILITAFISGLCVGAVGFIIVGIIFIPKNKIKGNDKSS